MKIIIRADAGFSGAKFYKMADENNLEYCIGLTRNERLKKFTGTAEEAVRAGYLEQGEKYQFFAGAFEYQADSWDKPQRCFAKIESTGKGMNVRYFCSNMEGQTARELYWDFYVKRGEASENRIKELIKKSGDKAASKWQINNIRLYLMKVGATIKMSVIPSCVL